MYLSHGRGLLDKRREIAKVEIYKKIAHFSKEIIFSRCPIHYSLTISFLMAALTKSIREWADNKMCEFLGNPLSEEL